MHISSALFRVCLSVANAWQRMKQGAYTLADDAQEHE